MKQWVRCLEPGGRLVVDVATPHNLPIGMAMERTGRRLGLPTDYNRDWVRSETCLREVLEAAGLVVGNIVPVEQKRRGGRLS